MIKILYVGYQGSGIFNYRLMPHNYLDPNKFEVHHTPMIDTGKDLTEDLKPYDIVVFNRLVASHKGKDYTDKTINEIKAAGCKLVIDVDDYWQLPKYHDLHKEYEKSFRIRMVKCLRAADIVLCATPFLRDKVLPYNKNVHVIKNCVDYRDRQWTWSDTKTPSDKLRVGYTGAAHHLKDIQSIADDFKQIAKLDVELNYYGFAHHKEAYEMCKIMSDNGNNKNFDAYPSLTAECYGAFYTRIDVLIAPLFKDEFTRCKSELKAVEAGYNRCAFVGSNQEPYTYLCNEYNSHLVNPGEWADAISDLMNEDRRKELAGNLFADVSKEYDLDNEVGKRARLYEELL